MADAWLQGGSVWENEMYAHLVGHTRREGEMLHEYVAAAEATESQAFSYLLELLVADERRHHQLFDELASSLKTDAELSSADPVIPRLDLRRANQSDLMRLTKKLLDNERADKKELRRLSKELRNFKDTTLWGLIVDLMMRDTEKHIAILEFILTHAEDPA
jgi:hypothetical protein